MRPSQADHVLIPTARFLHDHGAFEAGAWAVVLTVLGNSLFFTHGSDSAEFMALTGAALAIPAYVYSTALHAPGGGDAEAFTQLTAAWLAASTAPLAIHFQSTMLGYACVVALYTFLGFNVACFGLCWCIGWTKKDAMVRTLCSSVLLLVCFTALRVLQMRPQVRLTLMHGQAYCGLRALVT